MHHRARLAITAVAGALAIAVIASVEYERAAQVDIATAIQSHDASRSASRSTEQVRYDNQFSFIYSPRPKTGAALRENDWGLVPHEVKIERLERLQKIQRRISGEITQALVGSEVEVLVEGPSRYNPLKRFGRTAENRTVNFDGDAPAGAFVTALASSIGSSIVDQPSPRSALCLAMRSAISSSRACAVAM